MVVHRVHGRIGLFIRREANEAKATAAQGGAVLDDNLEKAESDRVHKQNRTTVGGCVGNTDSFLDLAELLESVAQGVIVGVPGQAAAGVDDRVSALILRWGKSGRGVDERDSLDEKFGHGGWLMVDGREWNRAKKAVSEEEM